MIHLHLYMKLHAYRNRSISGAPSHAEHDPKTRYKTTKEFSWCGGGGGGGGNEKYSNFREEQISLEFLYSSF